MARPRTPSAIKKTRGTYRADRNPIGEPTPQLTSGLGSSIPSGLFSEGEKLWVRLTRELEKSRVLTVHDMEVLRLLCATWGERWYVWNNLVLKDADGNRRTLKLYMMERGGVRKKMGELMTCEMLDDRFAQLANQFGLTPASRNKIAVVSSSKDEDDMEKLLKRVASRGAVDGNE